MHLRKEAAESRAQLQVSQIKCQQLTGQLQSAQLQLHSLSDNESQVSAEEIKNKLVSV